MNAAGRAALAALAQTSLDAAKASRDAVAALPVDGPSPGDPLLPLAWAARSASRMIAHRLASADASDANIAGRHPFTDWGVWTPDRGDIDQYDEPEIDNAGLRFIVRTGRGIPDWYRKFPVPFGANSQFRMQVAWRCNRAFREAVFRMRDPNTGTVGGWPGIKLAIICEAMASSTWPKLVLSTMDQHFFPFFYGYDQNGNTANIEPGINGGADFDWQPRLGEAPTCLYTRTNATPQGQAVPGCATLSGDEWVELYVECDTGDLIPGTNTWDCERRLYLAFNGGPRQLVIRFGPGSPGYYGRNAAPWTGIWLSPYMTYRDPQQLFPDGTPAVWYSSLIIDDKDIAPILVSELATPDESTLPPSNPAQAPQTIDAFTASRTALTEGESTTLAWATANGDATLDIETPGVDVPVEDTGSTTVTPAASRDFTLKATGSVPALARSISISVAPIVVPVPDPTLPSFVPPQGSFAEFTANVPQDVALESGSFFKATLANWTGGTFVDDYGTHGGAAYHGGGEHFSNTDVGGALVLNCGAQRYEMRCVPTNYQEHKSVAIGSSSIAGSLTDAWGAFRDDVSPQRKHTYNCLSQRPTAWGGGPMGSLVRVSHGGGDQNPIGQWPGLPPTNSYGLAATWAFDLAQERDGCTRLTGDQTYDFGSGKPAVVDDAVGTCMDWLRQGWWSFARTGSGHGDRMVFTHSDGRIDPPGTSAIGLAWGRLHHFADDDTLVAIASGGWMCHPGPTNPWKAIQWDVAAADQAVWASIQGYLGYIGFQWCSLLNCLVGIDTRPAPDLTTIKVWKIIPPDTAAKRWTDKWHVEREAITSADGSVIDVMTDHATNQGNGTSYGKLVEAKKLRALVWTRRIDKPGQLIRLRGM